MNIINIKMFSPMNNGCGIASSPTSSSEPCLLAIDQ